MVKSVKLLDVSEEWRDAQTRLKELMLSARCRVAMTDHGPAKKVVLFHAGNENQWLRLELGPHCWDLVDHTVARGVPITPELAMSTDEAFLKARAWLESHGCI